MLIPSVMVAVASSLLAMAAYRNFPAPKEPQTIILQLPNSMDDTVVEGISK
ncbi:hypothetical protein [Rhizobium sp. RAF56]|uniref:hypothetical protein n=1 Tax=Rhizobium sp. RAF56 TaxID=3233062 RepID=UPI003F9E1AE1